MKTKTPLVTGASSGIGETTARRLAVRPKVRYTAGRRANRLRWLRRFAPAGVLDAGIRKNLHLDAPTMPLPQTADVNA
jgi:NADP-dependent 3-hydroxy acid dehydrogenase YdfG